MRLAIVEAIKPEPSTSTKECEINAKKGRKRVQLNFGECLTEPEALSRLKQEEEDREKKNKVVGKLEREPKAFS